ncbi:hypothetical protein QNO07_09490 [Streptomyces sp. 549]|uniref:hypothetical protein n=1 Tax=Streptomyces sp. 549 TaxID=3049076 RepID=UPI0024C23C20|nr:hypothetical protein [Streptomyces sp. 549]MDK1473652.1 hypothetical protein [Streptomyces sp. 549]
MTNPPGGTGELLPVLVRAAIRPHLTGYTSTACQTAHALAEATADKLERAAELQPWRERMHRRCRLNHKFTGQPCDCRCHTTTKEPS